MTHKQTGFTLIEMMITVATLAIIVSIAVSSYQDQVRKAGRADGKALLADVSQQLERCYTKHGSYNNASCAASSSTQSSENNYYTVSVGGLAASTYSLTATAGNGQEKDTECGNLTLDQSGLQGITGSGSVDDCW